MKSVNESDIEKIQKVSNPPSPDIRVTELDQLDQKDKLLEVLDTMNKISLERPIPDSPISKKGNRNYHNHEKSSVGKIFNKLGPNPVQTDKRQVGSRRTITRQSSSGSSVSWWSNPDQSLTSEDESEGGSDGDLNKAGDIQLATNYLNVEVCRVLLDDDIFEHIIDPQTRDYLKKREAKIKQISEFKNLKTKSFKLEPQAQLTDIPLPNSSGDIAITQGMITERDRINSEMLSGPTTERQALVPSRFGLSSPLARDLPVVPVRGKAEDCNISVISRIPKKRVMTVKRIQGSMTKHLNDYAPIALLLTITHKMTASGHRLLWYDKTLQLMVEDYNPPAILCNFRFVFRTIRAILIHGEKLIFEELLKVVTDWNMMFSPEIIELYVTHSATDFLILFLKYFNKMLAAKKHEIQKGRKSIKNWLTKGRDTSIHAHPTTSNQIAPEEQLETGNMIEESKILSIIEVYFENSDDNGLLLEILRNMQLSDRHIVDLLLRSKQEDRFIEIATQNREMIVQISIDTVVDLKMYKVLSLIDRVSLIVIFGKQVSDTGNGLTVYKELCNYIRRGERIQSFCFIIMSVSYTYWDLDKLFQFYNSLSDSLRYESRNNWLLYVHNPLLFCIRLIYFFKKMHHQLDLRSKEITHFCEDLLAFCANYLETAKDETLMINLLDKDFKNRDFIEYVFMTREMTLLENDFVQGFLGQQWDLSRKSLHSLRKFMRLKIMVYEIQQFRLSIFCKSFSMPIEQSDRFRLEFAYTSNSVFCRVLSGIMWPIVIIVIEFVFSMILLQLRVKDRFDSNWLLNYIQDYTGLFILQVILRANHIINLLIRMQILGKNLKEWLHLRHFYQVMLAINFFQLVCLPIIGIDNFWPINISQLFLVCTLVAYVLYYGLCLDYIGVYLRIFFRMIYVVLVFGTVSCLIITMIAYPIHALFIDFSQVNNDSHPAEMNAFKDLYTGVTTLFEFAFGAVVFNRPYLEQNSYTYSMTFVMVIFAFFGNIMLANLMIAFLASQFDKITKNARYYTQRMQYGLIKVMNLPDLDTVMSLPFMMTIPMLPVLACMINPGKSRHRANLLLRKVVFVLNVFIPVVLIKNVYLLVLILKRYFDVVLVILLGVSMRPITWLYLPLWLALGPFLLVKLWIMDNCTMFKILLTFRDTGHIDILNLNLTSEEKDKLVHIFDNIQRVAKYLAIKKRVKKVTLNNFLFELGIYSKDNALNKLKEGDAVSLDDDKKAKKASTPSVRFTSLYKVRYNMDPRKLYPIILKKYVSTTEKGKISQKSTKDELDLLFLLQKLRNKVNDDDIHKLVSFDRPALETARLMMHNVEESNVYSEIKNLKLQMESMNTNIELLVKLAQKSSG